VPLSAWRNSAPHGVFEKLRVAQQHARSLVEARLRELRSDWDNARSRRLERLRARRSFAVEAAVARATVKAIHQRISQIESMQVRLRHQILGTQLFVVTH
jgi:hypothetical protein